MNKLRKVLIANRGEIAIRIIKTLYTLGITPVVVFSENDRNSLFTEMAQEKYLLDGDTVEQTYLNIGKIINIALLSHCDAIHPGYGFLAENPAFARECARRGLTFIGPPAEVIELMGDKLRANNHVASLGLPVIPRMPADQKDAEEGMYPVIVKAVAGGGGKGIRRVNHSSALKDAIAGVRREAQAYFGDNRIYIEKFLDGVRHVEVQIFGDGAGKAIHMYERECTVQRRNQKIIEEAPSATLNNKQREHLCRMAVDIAQSVNYKGAGTIEFLMDKNNDFYFLEMNTRIQVEHPVTEMITGHDLIAAQIHIAQYNNLPFQQKDISINGHAIQARIYAEDPEDDFNPAPGKILLHQMPQADGIRTDTGIGKSDAITGSYDPMVAKLIAHAPERHDCIGKLSKALKSYSLLGIPSNIDYLQAICGHQHFADNKLDTAFISNHHKRLLKKINDSHSSIPFIIPLAAYAIAMLYSKPGQENKNYLRMPGYWRQLPAFNLKIRNKDYNILLNIFEKTLNIFDENDVHTFININAKPGILSFSHNGKQYSIDNAFGPTLHFYCNIEGRNFKVINNLTAYKREDHHSKIKQNGDTETITAPMHGKVLLIGFRELEKVKKGDILMVIEAMKMENNIIAPRDATIKKINTLTGAQVEKNAALIILQ